MTETVVMDAAFRDAFTAAGMTRYEHFVSPPNAEELRRLPGRCNVKFTLPQGAFYLKVHGPARRSPWTFWRVPRPAGPAEYDNAVALRDAGVPCLRAAAAGESERGSFFVSADVAGGYQLDHYLRRNDVPRPERHAIVQALVGVVAALHNAGFCHKDLYLCHFFYRPEKRDLTLIDLQRVARQRPLGLRWRVKDLAALLYSWREPLTEEDWLAFFRAYCAAAPSGMDAGRLAHKISIKYEQIAMHDARAKASRPQPEIEDARP